MQSCNLLTAIALSLAVGSHCFAAATRTIPRTVPTWADLADEDIRGFWQSIHVLEAGREGLVVATTTAELPDYAINTNLAIADASGTGKWVRPARDRWSVALFGAIGDGTTDDTDAIRAAFASRLPIIVPPGTYVIDPLSLTNVAGLDVVGAGTATIKLADGSTAYSDTPTTITQSINVPDGTYGAVRFTHSVADAEGSTVAYSWGLDWSGQTNHFVNCSSTGNYALWTVDALYKAQLGVDGTHDIETVTHTGSTVTVVTETAHGLSPTDSVTLSGLLSYYNGSHTVATVPAADTFTITLAFPSVTTSRNDHSVRAGIYLEEPYGPVRFSNITFDGNGRDADPETLIEVYCTDGVQLPEVVFIDCTFVDAPARGMFALVNGPNNQRNTTVTIRDCNFANWNHCAIWVYGSLGNTVVADNTADNSLGWDESACSGSFGTGGGAIFVQRNNVTVYPTGSTTIRGNHVQNSHNFYAGSWYLESLILEGNTVSDIANNDWNTPFQQHIQGTQAHVFKVDDCRGAVNIVGNKFEIASALLAETLTNKPELRFEFSSNDTNQVVTLANNHLRGASARYASITHNSDWYATVTGNVFDGRYSGVGCGTYGEFSISGNSFVDGAMINDAHGSIVGNTFEDGYIYAKLSDDVVIANNVFGTSADASVIAFNVTGNANAIVTGNLKRNGSSIARFYHTYFEQQLYWPTIVYENNTLDLTGDTVRQLGYVNGGLGVPDKDVWWMAPAGTTIAFESGNNIFGAWDQDNCKIVIGTVPSDGNTLVIDGVTWTWRASPSATRDVLIGATTAECGYNLRKTLRYTLPWGNYIYHYGASVFIAGHANQDLDISQTGTWASITDTDGEYRGPIRVVVTEGAGSTITRMFAEYLGNSSSSGYDYLSLNRVRMFVAENDTVSSTAIGDAEFGTFALLGSNIVGPACVDLQYWNGQWHRMDQQDTISVATGTPSSGEYSPDLLSTSLFTVNMGGDLVLTNAANLASGRGVMLRILNDQATNCVLTLDGDWRSYGEASPITVPTNDVVRLSLQAFGATDADVDCAATLEN